MTNCLAGQKYNKIGVIYVSGSECIGRCGQLPLKGSASSDLHQFVRIVVIKSLNSNCVLVPLFQERRAREGETMLQSQSGGRGCLLTTSANATQPIRREGFVGM